MAINALLRLSAAELAAQIACRSLRATDVLAAYLDRIQAVDPHLNAWTVRLFESARSRAAEIDAAIERGEQLGRLAGVPVSIKDCFAVTGCTSAIGIRAWQQERAPHDSLLVARLRAAGAVILGKTAVPQLMLVHECSSPVHGRTCHPWDAERTPGGSTGGEAALLAAGGSCLGLGSDLGGSIRQPVHSCGIAGLKPTTGRLTLRGSVRGLRGFEAIGVQPGPMARTVGDLRLMLEVLGETATDHTDVRPFAPGELAPHDIRSLRIGYWEDDGYFTPAPGIRRAVRSAAASLERAGAQVIAVQPPDARTAMRVFMRLTSADGGADARRIVGDGPWEPTLKELLKLGRVPRRLRSLVARSARLWGQESVAQMLQWIGPLSADEQWQAVRARDAYREQFRAWVDEQQLDALLMPAHALPALRHGSSCYLLSAASYCVLPNVLGWPAGVVPATCIRPGEESDRPAARDLVRRTARAVELGSAGLPVGVQIVTRPWQEGLALAVMEAIETQLRDEQDFPRTPFCAAVDDRRVPNLGRG